MKKLVVLAIILVLSSCSFGKPVDTKDGFPDKFTWVEFWNGGTLLARYEYATIVPGEVRYTGRHNVVYTAFVYTITAGGKVENIVDSKALTMRYVE
jgi:hypothetical protein